MCEHLRFVFSNVHTIQGKPVTADAVKHLWKAQFPTFTENLFWRLPLMICQQFAYFPFPSTEDWIKIDQSTFVDRLNYSTFPPVSFHRGDHQYHLVTTKERKAKSVSSTFVLVVVLQVLFVCGTSSTSCMEFSEISSQKEPFLCKTSSQNIPLYMFYLWCIFAEVFSRAV